MKKFLLSFFTIALCTMVFAPLSAMAMSFHNVLTMDQASGTSGTVFNCNDGYFSAQNSIAADTTTLHGTIVTTKIDGNSITGQMVTAEMRNASMMTPADSYAATLARGNHYATIDQTKNGHQSGMTAKMIRTAPNKALALHVLGGGAHVITIDTTNKATFEPTGPANFIKAFKSHTSPATITRS